jgi:nicotinate-nucleotide adenylyltransferase
MITKKRIGVLGGTFDPIHLGHLLLGEYIRQQYHLEKIVFIPTGESPHKDKQHTTDKCDRYKMVELAIKDNADFLLSGIEVFSEEKSYTIQTIKKLKEIYKEDYEIFFIVGADALLEIESWKDFQELLQACNFIVAERLGAHDEKLMDKVEDLIKYYGARIHIADMPRIAISSSMVRQSVKENKSIKYLVLDEVERYIYEKKLYC